MMTRWQMCQEHRKIQRRVLRELPQMFDPLQEAFCKELCNCSASGAIKARHASQCNWQLHHNRMRKKYPDQYSKTHAIWQRVKMELQIFKALRWSFIDPWLKGQSR